MSRHITRMFCAVAAGFALTASGLATACAASVARPSLSGRTAQSAIICCAVSAVAATSARNAWAVGSGRRTVILHWNGTAWEKVRSPNPTPDYGENLTGVAATSARNAWVVGYAGGGGQALIAHWNGVSWMT